MTFKRNRIRTGHRTRLDQQRLGANVKGERNASLTRPKTENDLFCEMPNPVNKTIKGMTWKKYRRELFPVLLTIEKKKSKRREMLQIFF